MSGHGLHEQSHTGLWTRYRSLYEKLPPGAQMVGLQMWLPLVFVLAFCLCYIGAFHAPSPSHVPVAVVGQSAQVRDLAHSLEAGSHGALTVKVDNDLAQGRADVRSGDVAAAYVPDGSSARLVIATANQYQLAQLAKATFATVAATSGARLTTQDLAPLPHHDAYGTTLFYLTLVSTIGGYMTGMFVGMMGGALRHRVRFAIVASSAVVLPLISTMLVRFALGAVRSHFFALWGIGCATALAVGLVVNGLGYFFGRFVTAVALLVFIFANVPSSGGAYPPEFVPQPFRALNHIVSGTGTLDLERSAVYNVGPGGWHGALILGCYAVAGLVLAGIGKPLNARRMARRSARGVRPNMMVTAQMAAMSSAQAGRESGADVLGAGPKDDAQLSVKDIQSNRDADLAAASSALLSAESDSDASAAVTGAEG